MASLQLWIIWFVIFMNSFVMRSVVLKKREIVWTIFSAFMSAGIESTIVSGVPLWSGSRKRSSVDRNLELSLASLAALVMQTSI
jgi:hypothetical protein